MTQTMTADTFTRTVNERLTEREFQQQVVTLAWQLGWWVYHTHDSRRSQSGFPDLVLIRNRVVYAEIKTERGRVTPNQQDVLRRLRDAGQETYVWRPSDREELRAVLLT